MELGIAGLLIGIAGIAVAVVTYARSERGSRERAERLPDKIADRVRLILAIPKPDDPNALGAYAGYADINNDGRPELIIQHPAGVHGMAFLVFGWRGFDFGEVATTSWGTPTSVKIKDFDGDGQLEIGILVSDWEAGRPYINAPSIEVHYRLEGNDFVEVGRGTYWDRLAESEPPDSIRDYFGPPHWGLAPPG